MKFHFVYPKEEAQLLRTYLREEGVSKQLLAKIKFQGGKIEVDGKECNVLVKVQKNQVVTITTPVEKEHEGMQPSNMPLDIVFEDEHFLVVNKPAHLPSIPSQYHPNQTMANRVKAYYQKQNYANQVVHVVTRLDRDTTGLMLFAKHGFAHAKMDALLREKKVEKRYKALVSGDIDRLKKTDSIVAPIARDLASLLKRKVDDSGQYAHTEYFLERRKNETALVSILLHTGRTHQIRVHFEHLHCSLLGDEMYGGRMDLGMSRQALHCAYLSFVHPFTKEKMVFQKELPEDMKKIAIRIGAV